MYLWPCIQMDLLQIRKFVVKFISGPACFLQPTIYVYRCLQQIVVEKSSRMLWSNGVEAIYIPAYYFILLCTRILYFMSIIHLINPYFLICLNLLLLNHFF